MKPIKNLGKIDITTLADYILKFYGPMSHLKLQKLLYYCQAYHIAYFEVPLVDEPFEAWVHGPVSRKIYDDLKGASVLYSDVSYEGGGHPEEGVHALLNSDQMALIDEVLKGLSKWTSFELESATHREAPWLEARKGYNPADKCNVVIAENTMKLYYQSELGLN